MQAMEANPYTFLYDWYNNEQVYNPRARPLIASLDSISLTGELIIEFNKDMLIPEQLRDFQRENREQATPMFLIESILHISVASSDDIEGSDRLRIESYEMISYEKKTLKIQVTFMFPNYISMNAVDKDRLRVSFRETWFFVDEAER